MFSGIVERMGKIVEYDLQEKWGRIALESTGWDPAVISGESIACQGICLTVAEQKDNIFYFDVLRETFERTNLGDKKVGDLLNMERSLRWGQPMGGHIVVGHIDGVGEVRSIEQVGRDWKYEIGCSPELMDGMVFKGSVGLDGVSLTIAELREESIVVHIIPFTYHETTFHCLKVGDHMNVEIDLLGKFVHRLLDRGRVLEGVTWDALRESGLIYEPVPSETDQD